jgi:Fe2+ transport system protein B
MSKQDLNIRSLKDLIRNLLTENWYLGVFIILLILFVIFDIIIEFYLAH